METKVTIKQVKARAKELGIKAKWSADWQEWDVQGYFTDDHADALHHVEFFANLK
ncbi:hypothetical protein RPALISO_245 [Ruegeria phage RpAliso]|nr:hypothetical protein RPALISO_245 [Ruegeria phage RpAliso]